MKVLIVAPYFYPQVGGAEVYTINIARQLKDMGWEVSVVTTGKSRLNAFEVIEGMTVYRLKTLITLSNTPVGLGWRRDLKRIFSVEKPDVINAHTPVPFIADVAQRACGGIPFVLTYHNDLAKDSRFAKFLTWAANRLLIGPTLRGSDRIVATSDYYVEESRYLKRHKEKVRVVSPGVNVSIFNSQVIVTPDLSARFLGQRVILFVGSLNKSHRHKGLDVLISAFERIHRESPDTRLVVVGQGDGMEMYKSMAEAVGVADIVEFTGYVEDAGLAQYYRLAAVYAMPSTNRSEGFGMTYIEANATGTPVIGSRVGGVPYVIRENETGILVEPRDVDGLYRALRLILDDADLARRLGDAGAKRVLEEFGWRSLAERTSNILKELASYQDSSVAN